MKIRVKRPLLLTALSVVLLGAAAPDPIFEKRFNSFTAAGYDALTAPPEWYEPTEKVVGGNGPFFPAVAPEEHRISSAALTAAASYAEAQGSTALIVIYRGRVEYEHYWRDDGPDSFFNPQSMSKSVLGLMVGAAIADGKIRSVEDTVDRYVPEWKGDPRGKIRIEDLLHMASGLEQLEGQYGYALTPMNPAARQQFGGDFYGPILGMHLVGVPGSKFDYNNNTANLLGIVVQRATGERYAQFLSEKLWQPLALRNAKLYLDKPGGNPITACCILSRPRDWAKIGILIAHDGNWNGSQVVRSAWIESMTKPSPAYAGYGYMVWLGDQHITPERPKSNDKNASWQSEPFAARDMVVLRGYGFQRVWIIPSEDLVIVRAGKSWPASWDESVIPNVILRGLRGGQ